MPFHSPKTPKMIVQIDHFSSDYLLVWIKFRQDYLIAGFVKADLIPVGIYVFASSFNHLFLPFPLHRSKSFVRNFQRLVVFLQRFPFEQILIGLVGPVNYVGQN
jgi:hypothetical protein